MNEENRDSTWSPSDPFEQLLEACQPAGGNQLEQILYQAGWNAAMVQSAKSAQVTESAQNAKQARPKRWAASSLRWFGSGLGTGLAVSLLVMVLILKFADPAQLPSMSRSGLATETQKSSLDLSPTRKESVVAMPVDHSVDTNSSKPGSDIRVNSLFAWGDIFRSPSREWGGRLSLRPANGQRSDVEWDALPDSYRYQEDVWKDVRHIEDDDSPSRKLFSRPLTEAQIKELL